MSTSLSNSVHSDSQVNYGYPQSPPSTPPLPTSYASHIHSINVSQEGASEAPVLKRQFSAMPTNVGTVDSDADDELSSQEGSQLAKGQLSLNSQKLAEKVDKKSEVLLNSSPTPSKDLDNEGPVNPSSLIDSSLLHESKSLRKQLRNRVNTLEDTYLSDDPENRQHEEVTGDSSPSSKRKTIKDEMNQPLMEANPSSKKGCCRCRCTIL